jgi:hypothetical protein
MVTDKSLEVDVILLPYPSSAVVFNPPKALSVPAAKTICATIENDKTTIRQEKII